MCVLKDEVDAAQDGDLATFIINSHIKSHPNEDDEDKSKVLLNDPHKCDQIGDDYISQEL